MSNGSTSLKKRALRILRTVSILWAVAALLMTPALMRSNGYAALFALSAILLAACPIIFLDNVGVGTRYRFWHSAELWTLGVPQQWQRALSWLSTLLVVLIVFSWALTHWSKSPLWLSAAFERGLWAGPFFAVVLLQSAAGFHTTLYLLDGGMIKRCSAGHGFTPFARRCPICGAKRRLELVSAPLDT